MTSGFKVQDGGKCWVNVFHDNTLLLSLILRIEATELNSVIILQLQFHHYLDSKDSLVVCIPGGQKNIYVFLPSNFTLYGGSWSKSYKGWTHGHYFTFIV